MDKGKGKVKDITVEILISIRDEIRTLREDTNRRFEQMDKRFERMDKRFEQMDKRLERIENDISEMRQDINMMKQDIKAIVAHFERDYILLANKMGTIEGRLDAHLQEAHQ